MTAIPDLPELEFIRGSDWKVDLPTSGTIEIDGTDVDWEAAGYLQLQWRARNGTGTPTRWKTSDGASRYDSTNNAFLVPDDDAILTTGSGPLEFDYDIHYFDASGNPTLIGEKGTIKVRDAGTGAGA